MQSPLSLLSSIVYRNHVFTLRKVRKDLSTVQVVAGRVSPICIAVVTEGKNSSSRAGQHKQNLQQQRQFFFTKIPHFKPCFNFHREIF